MSEYEFSPEQNVIVSRLVGAARLAGVLDLVLVLASLGFVGQLLALGGTFTVELGVVVASAVLIGIYGIWLLRAAGAFKKIVTTQGSDISHMLAAFRQLAKIYRTQFWIYLLCFLAGIALMIVRLILRA